MFQSGTPTPSLCPKPTPSLCPKPTPSLCPRPAPSLCFTPTIFTKINLYGRIARLSGCGSVW
ncbi:MAG: hypothetical protein FWE41_02895 [Coriobacteriia bacterium]|nr:hypothetical protein [Coriobacteriia bacterium]MCL2750402.1 hypothetical protein [Coriobacteriia bacterium]